MLVSFAKKINYTYIYTYICIYTYFKYIYMYIYICIHIVIMTIVIIMIIVIITLKENSNYIIPISSLTLLQRRQLLAEASCSSPGPGVIVLRGGLHSREPQAIPGPTTTDYYGKWP